MKVLSDSVGPPGRRRAADSTSLAAMRTPSRLHPVLFGLSALTTSLLALAACSDSLHLDPQPAPPGAGAGGVGGQGGGATTPCQSSSDCPFPTSVCDTEKGLCVECLEHSDCSYQPGTVCSQGACACPREGEEFCPELGKPNQSGYQSARCVDPATAQLDCGSCGHACFGVCTEGACADPWEPTSLVDAPSARTLHTAVWTGSKMIIWGGNDGAVTNTGGIYDPATRAWIPTSMANAPAARQWHTAVWTGDRMIVWGGWNGASPLGDGAVFDPATNTWASMPKPSFGFPSRFQHSAVWAGAEMIIWGGASAASPPGSLLGDGARFDPAGGAWQAVQSGGPEARRMHTAVWADPGTAPKMIVFGGHGFDGVSTEVPIGTGGVYDPSSNTWITVPPGGAAPAPRAEHTAIWADSTMIVWGGRDAADNPFGDGAKIDTGFAQWGAVNANGPAPRAGHSAVWMKAPVSRMIVWGGRSGGAYFSDGGIYDPEADTWALEMPSGPQARAYHAAVATDDGKMIVWGGQLAGGQRTNTGGVFDPAKMAGQ